MRGEWCYWKNYFSSDYCNKIVDSIKDTSLIDPYIGHYNQVSDFNYRNGKITWLDLEEYSYIYDDIWKLARKINEEWFNFHITGFENIQFTRYLPKGKGFYKKHQDVFWLNSTEKHRKLTCVIQLSNPDSYSGGNLILHNCDEYPDKDEIKGQGTVIFFPSFVYHEVEEVVDGERCSLVCWLDGPKWR